MMTGRSLRFRLTVWYTGLLAATLIILSVSLFLSLSYNLQRHHDGEMVRECKKALALVQQAGGCANLQERHHGVSGELGHKVEVRAVGVSDRVLPGSPVTDDVALVTRRGRDGDVRVASAIYRPADGSRACLIEVTDSLGNLDSTLGSLRLLLLLLVPLVLAVATLGGILIVRKALQPLEEIVNLTQQIEARKLGLRLDLHKAPREIAGLAATFNQMIGRLEASFEQMKKFTADASHELRTPLAVLTSSIEVALQRERPSEEYRRVMGVALSQVRQLTKIAEDLLVLSQAEAGKLGLRVEEVSIGSLLRQSVAAIAPRVVAGGLTLRTENLEDVNIDGDSRWLRQLFDNLLDNAVKYTPPGGSVTLMWRQEGGEVMVEVRDTGIGIPEEELPHIFSRFYRVDPARSRDVGGNGLGLSIALWVARSHGGRIDVDSAVGKGSRFRVILPSRFSKTERYGSFQSSSV